jgi:hypothetical protein
MPLKTENCQLRVPDSASGGAKFHEIRFEAGTNPNLDTVIMEFDGNMGRMAYGLLVDDIDAFVEALLNVKELRDSARELISAKVH